jgi:NSS family neurotransmitter:Na+ symporter
LGLGGDAAAILPPESGFDGRSFVLQLVCTGVVILACALVLLRGLRSGIERASRWVMPLLFVVLGVLIVRGLTLPGSFEGVAWYILKFDLSELSGGVVLAALGQAFFSLSLGGTFMVVYGSYLDREAPLASSAFWTALGDLMAGLLAGLAILPAVFAFGLAPASGPALTFVTLPQVFDQLPLGWLFGFLFFAALLGAAWLSDVGAFEVLVAGLTDGTGMSRRRAVWTMSGVVMLVSVPPMISMRVFVPWDLTFGSGMQTLGALVAVIAVGWWIDRAKLLREFGGESRRLLWLYHWLRWVVPAIILAVGFWWLATDVLSLVSVP